MGECVAGVEQDPKRRAQAQSEIGMFTFPSLKSAIAEMHPDAAVICTPSLSHASIVEACLDNGLHVFTELNLIDDGYADNIARAKEQGLVWFPSSTFVYRHEIKAIQKAVGNDPHGAWTYHVGQYLPDWHPWESYKSFFVADTRTSGIRELLAIELPWLTKTFGPIQNAHFASQKLSDLEIAYDDTIALIIEHEGGSIGTLLIDVISRKVVRDFSFSSQECYVTWDGSPTGLAMLDLDTHEMTSISVYGDHGATQREDYAHFIVEDAYKEELAAFLDAIMGAPSAQWTLEEDSSVISLIDSLGV